MLYLIRGLPGSGKSTLAKKLALIPNTCHFEADMFHVDSEGVYQFNPCRVKDAHAWCLAVTHQALKEGCDAVVSNTFTRVWEMQRYLDLGYPVTVITCEGNYGSIHSVPQEVIKSMRDRWEKF